MKFRLWILASVVVLQFAQFQATIIDVNRDIVVLKIVSETPLPVDANTPWELYSGVGNDITTGHFRLESISDLFENEETMPDFVRLSIRAGGEEKAFFEFNAADADSQTWFSYERLVSTSYSDLPESDDNVVITFNMSGTSQHPWRQFYIGSPDTSGCGGGGYFMIVSGAELNTSMTAACSYEQDAYFHDPLILYSTAATDRDESVESKWASSGRASEMHITFRYKYRRHMVCAERSQDLLCASNERLQIVSAVWGSFPDSPVLCSDPRPVYSPGCEVDAWQYVTELCRNETTCTLSNNNHDIQTHLGDPCYGVHKHFEVAYTCTQETACTSHTDCDGGTEYCSASGDCLPMSDDECCERGNGIGGACPNECEYIYEGRVCGCANCAEAVFTSNYDGPVQSLRLKHMEGTGMACGEDNAWSNPEVRYRCVSNWGCNCDPYEDFIAISIFYAEGNGSNILFPDDTQRVDTMYPNYYSMNGFTGMSTELIFTSPADEPRQVRRGVDYRVKFGNLGDEGFGATCADLYFKPPDECAQHSGIASTDGAVCCPVSCLTCGGEECADAEGGVNSCCQEAITRDAEVCGDDGTTAPCVMPDRCTPYSGIESPHESPNGTTAVCCPMSCGFCDDELCGERPGGAESCCARAIIANATVCGDGTMAPCIAETELPTSTQTPATTEPNGPPLVISSVPASDSSWSSARVAGVVVGGLAGLCLYTLLLVYRKQLARWFSRSSDSKRSKHAAARLDDAAGNRHVIELERHSTDSEEFASKSRLSRLSNLSSDDVDSGSSEGAGGGRRKAKNLSTSNVRKSSSGWSRHSSSSTSSSSSIRRSTAVGASGGGSSGGIVIAGTISVSKMRRSSLEGVVSFPGKSRSKKQTRSRFAGRKSAKYDDGEEPSIGGEGYSDPDISSTYDSSQLEPESEPELELNSELESEPDVDNEHVNRAPGPAVGDEKRPKKPKRRQCDECGLWLSSISNLSTHKREKHRGVEGHRCKVCKKRFTRKFNLQVHERTHEKSTKRLPWECSICHDGFSQRSNLKRHIVVRHEKPGKCSVCSERFGDDASYQEHYAEAHAGEKARKLKVRQLHMGCGLCSKKFAKLSALRNHEATDADCAPTVAAFFDAFYSDTLQPVDAEAATPARKSKSKPTPTPTRKSMPTSTPTPKPKPTPTPKLGHPGREKGAKESATDDADRPMLKPMRTAKRTKTTKHGANCEQHAPFSSPLTVAEELSDDEKSPPVSKTSIPGRKTLHEAALPPANTSFHRGVGVDPDPDSALPPAPPPAYEESSPLQATRPPLSNVGVDPLAALAAPSFNVPSGEPSLHPHSGGPSVAISRSARELLIAVRHLLVQDQQLSQQAAATVAGQTAAVAGTPAAVGLNVSPPTATAASTVPRELPTTAEGRPTAQDMLLRALLHGIHTTPNFGNGSSSISTEAMLPELDFKSGSVAPLPPGGLSRYSVDTNADVLSGSGSIHQHQMATALGSSQLSQALPPTKPIPKDHTTPPLITDDIPLDASSMPDHWTSPGAGDDHIRRTTFSMSRGGALDLDTQFPPPQDRNMNNVTQLSASTLPLSEGEDDDMKNFELPTFDPLSIVGPLRGLTLTGFDSNESLPVHSNVTLASPPALSTQQHENADGAVAELPKLNSATSISQGSVTSLTTLSLAPMSPCSTLAASTPHFGIGQHSSFVFMPPPVQVGTSQVTEDAQPVQEGTSQVTAQVGTLQVSEDGDTVPTQVGTSQDTDDASPVQLGTSHITEDEDTAPAVGRMASGVLGNHADGLMSAHLDQSLDTAMSVNSHSFAAFESPAPHAPIFAPPPMTPTALQLRSGSFDFSGGGFAREYMRRNSDSIRSSQ